MPRNSFCIQPGVSSAPTIHFSHPCPVSSSLYLLHQMYGGGAAPSLPSGLKGNSLRLPLFLTGHTARIGADVLFTVQEAENQRQCFSSALSLSRFLQNILQVGVFGTKELDALMTAHFCLSATSLGYFNLT